MNNWLFCGFVYLLIGCILMEESFPGSRNSLKFIFCMFWLPLLIYAGISIGIKQIKIRRAKYEK